MALTGLACVLWYIRPTLGPWPLALAATGRLIRTLTIPHRGWQCTAFDLPLAMFLVSAGISAWLSYDQAAGWAKFWVIVGGLLLYDSLALAPEEAHVGRWRLRPVTVVVGLLPALIAAYFLLTNDWAGRMGKLEALDPLLRWLASWQPALPGHRLHPNVAGGLIAGLLPLQVAAVGRTKAGWPLIGLAAFGLLTTASRGAWIALAIGLVVWMWMAQRSTHVGRISNSPYLAVGMLLVIVAVVALVSIPAAVVGLRSALSDRLTLLRNSLDLALDYPFTGLGLAGFPMAFSSYVLLLHVPHTVHSHNLFLNLWIEQGLLGVAAFGWLVGKSSVVSRQSSVGGRQSAVGGRQLSVSSRQSSVSGRQSAVSGRQWRGAALAALATILIHGLVDDAFYGSRGVLLLFVPFALLARCGASPSRGAWPCTPTGRRSNIFRRDTTCGACRTKADEIAPQRRRGRRVFLDFLGVLCVSAVTFRTVTDGGAGRKVGILILALALALALLPPVRAIFQANLAALLQTRAELSVYRWPAYLVQDALRRQAPNSPPPVDLGPAIGRYRAALALDPRNAAANRRLGQIELSLGQYDAARTHLEAAYASAPGQRATRQLLGESDAIAGDVERAAALWRTIDVSQGQLELRAWWYERIGEPERAERVRRAAGVKVEG